MEIKPTDIQHSSGNTENGKNSSWVQLSSSDLIDIYRFALQYQIFEKMKMNLESPFLRYHYVIPKSLDLKGLSINRMICKNPPLCIRFIRRNPNTYLNNDNLFISATLLDVPVFLTTVLDSIQTIDLKSPPTVTYISQIRIPEKLLHRVPDLNLGSPSFLF